MHLRNMLLFISFLAITSFLSVNPALAAQNNLTTRLLLNQSLIHDSNFYYDPIDEIGVTVVRGRI